MASQFSNDNNNNDESKMDKTLLKAHLECNICLELPYVGLHVYVCTRGHDICKSCFDKLTTDKRGRKICPNGRCPFANPPVRNRTVESIIEGAGFDTNCPNLSQGCKIRGNPDDLSRHMSNCPYKRVDCIEYGQCRLKFYPNEMASHLKANHSNVVFINKFNIQKWLMKTGTHLEESKVTAWNFVVCTELGRPFGIRFSKYENIWFTWVVLLGEKDEASQYECEIKVKQAKDPKSFYLYRGKISSVRSPCEEIMANGHCLMLTNDCVLKCITNKDISNASRRAGFNAQLPVSYSVTKLTGPRRSSVCNQPFNVYTQGGRLH